MKSKESHQVFEFGAFQEKIKKKLMISSNPKVDLQLYSGNTPQLKAIAFDLSIKLFCLLFLDTNYQLNCQVSNSLLYNINKNFITQHYIKFGKKHKMKQNYRKVENNVKTYKQDQYKFQKQNVTQRKNFNINDKNWIGEISSKKVSQSNIQTPKNIQNNSRPVENISKVATMSKRGGQSPLAKLASSLYRNQDSYTTNSGQKNPMQLMNDIFRVIGINHLSNSKAFYSRQSQSLLCQLLSNKDKMNNYIKKLSNQITQATPQVQKNYQILLILLQQLNEADLQVHQDQNGIKICFNRQQLIEKQKQVQTLEKQLQERNRQTQKIVEQYQGVIRNFNDVIEKLIEQKKF